LYAPNIIRTGIEMGIEIEIVSSHENWAWMDISQTHQIKPMMEIELEIRRYG